MIILIGNKKCLNYYLLLFCLNLNLDSIDLNLNVEVRKDLSSRF